MIGIAPGGPGAEGMGFVPAEGGLVPAEGGFGPAGAGFGPSVGDTAAGAGGADGAMAGDAAGSGMTGFPVAGAGAGGRDRERHRQSWMAEDADVWEPQADVVPAQIGA